MKMLDFEVGEGCYIKGFDAYDMSKYVEQFIKENELFRPFWYCSGHDVDLETSYVVGYDVRGIADNCKYRQVILKVVFNFWDCDDNTTHCNMTVSFRSSKEETYDC